MQRLVVLLQRRNHLLHPSFRRRRLVVRRVPVRVRCFGRTRQSQTPQPVYVSSVQHRDIDSRGLVIRHRPRDETGRPTRTAAVELREYPPDAARALAHGDVREGRAAGDLKTPRRSFRHGDDPLRLQVVLVAHQHHRHLLRPAAAVRAVASAALRVADKEQEPGTLVEAPAVCY